ncbi:MAG TPA: flagellar basal body rod protein FlgB [Firmicutes bacterium]|nr:flagellar basal body rod protein FlgB [Bacillota bacterium]HOQ23583.1 flagellar basal body rod protein FlgB [Bacillota bacterium]HPT67244.1 flagellar basal body rod protein FlgB [Bacillota bacterium]
MIDHPTVNTMKRALDVSALRHELLAQNIANVDTPGYRRIDLSFATILADAEKQLAMDRTNKAHLPGKEDSGMPLIVRRVEGAARNDGNNVVIETEMARLTQNTMYFQAVSAQLGKYFDRLRLVISGRR